MGTIVSFHAHPDDESIASSGTLRRAADAGHRVVLVFGTRGELGEPVPGVLAEGEQLSMRRTAEVYRSAEVIGAARVEFLGYTDSGMIGEDTNEAPWCFWQADVEQAAHRLAAILAEEQPDVLTIYDDNGGYGHPDHIQVHRVGKRAAELVPGVLVVQGTMNRDHIQEAFRRAAELGVEIGPPSNDEEPDGVAMATGAAEPAAAEPDAPAPEFGKPEEVLTHVVDATPVIVTKRASMRCHESQIGPDHFMSSIPDEAFAFAFGQEWYLVEDVPADPPELFTTFFTPKATFRAATSV